MKCSHILGEGTQNTCEITNTETEPHTTKQLISPKMDPKVPVRGIKFSVFKHVASDPSRYFQPMAEPNNSSPVCEYVVNNETAETIEIDGPEVLEPPVSPEPSMASTTVVDTEPLSALTSEEAPMMDLVLFFAEDDAQTAHEFKEHLHKEIKIDNLSIDLFSDIDCGQSELPTLGTVHDRYNNILALITPNLKLDKYACFVQEILLTVGLKEANGKENRIIPVWAVADRMIITAFIPLKGINYHRFLTCRLEASKDSYRKMVEGVIMKGRQKQIDLQLALRQLSINTL